ncbi:enoyl-CoA hydratase-related protein [Maribacter sp. 2308TA10-17]|uniref:enoyl-CoA hydratase-related protein n=1 Tax=Maribacter sp. 2308TA10-17 TaxID=3386276 RepID=UPI0039BCE5D6
MSTVQKDIENGVAFLRLNRPDVFNSFNREMALQFQKELNFCEQSELVRAIVVMGNGKAFCAGQDLKEVTNKDLDLSFRTLLEEHYAPIIKIIRGLKKPVIAAVDGVAAGAGANIALACDVVLASERTSFIQVFSGIGLVPDSGGTFFLPRLIGFQKASALAMLGDKIKADEAERIGMIYKVFPVDAFEEEIRNIAVKMASMPTLALVLIKQALNASMTNSLEEQLKLETELQLQASESNDYEEGVTAFLQKRKPNFKGN